MTVQEQWTTIEKSDWGAGPWQSEPDKAQWKDDATGLDCLIVRGPHGALCGYVGIAPDHPLHGSHYDAAYEQADIEVHGGLTYADGCQHSEDTSRGICHIPAPGEPDALWWFGFDCAYAGDWSPKYDGKAGPDFQAVCGLGCPTGWGGVIEYRDLTYVREQCASLARQLTPSLRRAELLERKK